MTQQAQNITTIGRAIVIHDKKILLLRNQYPDGEFYGFPGGCQELDETLEAAALRETFEETNIKCRVVKPLYIHEFIEEGENGAVMRHLVTLYFLLEPLDPSEKPDHTRDPDEHERKIQEALWMPLEKMKELKMRPAEVARAVLDDVTRVFSGEIKKIPTTRAGPLKQDGC